MVRIVKSEWHSVEKRYDYELDEILLSEIYPDLTEDEIAELLQSLESAGGASIEDIIEDAWENGVDIDWNYMDEDDWWTDRKGGYDVTYKVEQ